MTCPWCCDVLSVSPDIVQKKYARHSPRDRKLVWKRLWDVMGADRCSSESGKIDGRRLNEFGGVVKDKERGNRPKILRQEHLEVPIAWLEWDSAPAHSRCKDVAQEMELELLRLDHYSRMLNPIENV